jgi:hypothetical protein
MSQNTLDLAGSIYAGGLNKPNDYKLVYNLADGYNTASTLFAAWNQSASDALGLPLMTGNDKYEFATEDVNWVNESITNNTQSGANLVLTYSGTNDFFRNGQTVIDSNLVQGQVIDHGAGTVTICPVTIALVAGTHFVIGTYVKEFSFAAAFRASKGTSPLYTVPTKDYDYPQNFRGTSFLAATDFQDTYPMYNGKSWGHRQVDKALMQMAVEKERQLLLGDRATFNSPQGTTYTTASLKWAAMNRGGQYVPLTTALTTTMWSNILQTQRVKKATRGGKNKIILCGDGFLTYFQNNFTQQFVTTAGVNNTFGGQTVKGLDIRKWAIAGEEYDILHLPFFDDPNYWVNDTTTIAGYYGGKMSNSFFIIDPNVIGSVGSGVSRPPVQYLYWGQKGVNVKVINGMVNIDGSSNTGMGSAGGYMNTSDDTDGATIQALEKCGNHIPSGKGITFCQAIV